MNGSTSSRIVTLLAMTPLVIALCGCVSVHSAQIRVVVAESRAPLGDASVTVVRKSLRFLSLRAKPDFPTYQEGVTNPNGEVAIQLIDGDAFEITAEHSRYERPTTTLLAPWEHSKDGSSDVIVLEMHK